MANSHSDAGGPAPDTFGSQNANVPSAAGGEDAHADVPKHEVGWYFVKQYYTNLSRSPDKWHLFYTKRSQFVLGVEAEKVPVSVGRTTIAERIKELDFQDCKVRVSNVDSQASFDNIVIQVIGEISIKSAPHRKFVQTFVLAQQPNGYFVLNDIFRYINDEDEDDADVEVYHEGEQSQASERHDEPHPPEESDKAPAEPAVPEHQQQQRDAERIDAKLEAVVAKPDDAATDEPDGAVPAPMPNGNGAADANHEVADDPHQPEDAPPVSADAEETAEEAPAAVAEPVEATKAAAEEEEEEPVEAPKEPEPTPAATPPAATTVTAATTTPGSVPQAPNAAPAKSAPKTWANLVALGPSASGARSPVPSTSPAPPSQPRAAPPASDDVEASPTPAAPQGPHAGWQTAGNEHARRQARPLSMSATSGDKVLAYVKNVTDRVSADALRDTLQQYGHLAYFDISRQKNCAFVEFSSAAGYQAAVAANPHQVGGEQIYVEERRPRSGAYGGPGYNANRGGPGRGRGGPPDGRLNHQGRGGFLKDGGGGRGGYGPSRGRGGSMTPRGRGGPPIG